jgi:hypothetical protein
MWLPSTDAKAPDPVTLMHDGAARKSVHRLESVTLGGILGIVTTHAPNLWEKDR